MYAGEPFPVPQLGELMAALPGVKVANIYGPTETNIITCFWVEELDLAWRSVPLGRVVEGSEILVVSEDGARICAEGEVGELWCRGNTVTLGYLGNAEQTSRCFVQSPFHGFPAWFWRTGDYGFRDSQGLLHYRGRRDHMVKIKGYRVELGDIESRLATMEGLDEFCVVHVSKCDHESRLVCCYSTKDSQERSPEDLVAHLRSHLPAYMVPERFQFYRDLPKTSSGKISRVQLASEVSECEVKQ
jgi:acyl-coenzyme A synthetase/AMP-(fatty) acid ligase